MKLFIYFCSAPNEASFEMLIFKIQGVIQYWEGITSLNIHIFLNNLDFFVIFLAGLSFCQLIFTHMPCPVDLLIVNWLFIGEIQIFPHFFLLISFVWNQMLGRYMIWIDVFCLQVDFKECFIRSVLEFHRSKNSLLKAEHSFNNPSFSGCISLVMHFGCRAEKISLNLRVLAD